MAVMFLRHGRWDVEHGRRFRGHGVDLTPLSPDGEDDAEAAGHALAAAPPNLILASPMTRALQTAMIVAWHVDRPVVVELDLHEWMPDDTQSWIDGTVPQAAAAEMRSCGGEWPLGETRAWEPLSAIRRRVGAVIDRRRNAGDLLVVCHSVVIEAMTGLRDAAHCEPVPCPASSTVGVKAGRP